MTRFQLLLFIAVILAAADMPEASCGSEGQHARSISLNGPWLFAVVRENDRAENPPRPGEPTWKNVTLPGPFMPHSADAVAQIAFVWAKRKFQLTPDQAKSMAVLRWNFIALGAVAFINGVEVGRNEPIGPYQTIISPGVLKTGENEILLKVAGTRGAGKAKSGFLLVPAGFGCSGDMPAILDDVWIDFADRAYIKWALAIPDLAQSKVTIRVTPAGLERLDDLTIRASVRPWPRGNAFATAQAPASLVPNPDPIEGDHFFVDVPMPGFKPWTPEYCNLHLAEVDLLKGKTLLDRVTFRFGMRTVKVEDRNYKLNGKNLYLRGSNLVFEWHWGDTITGHEFDYLVTEAKEMSMNSFRTHTRPPPKLWADICDENGTMILAEFPVLYNYQDYKFTPDELKIWHRNCMTDATGWMARLWNHPAVIIWVLSNESNRDNEWEQGPFQDFVNAMDPTRTTLRTGTSGTKDNYDVHTCGNITNTLEGNLAGGIPAWFQTAGDRTTTNTEYMNYFGHPKTQWAGIDDGTADQIAVAQIGAEHTEAMRRHRVDGIWPYMYAGWTRTRLAARVRETGKGSAVWKANYASPVSAAWHSSLSPVLASLDLFDASYRTGQQVITPLCLINDSWHDAKIHVDLLLTDETPEYIPEAPCFDRPVAKWSYDFTLKADTIKKTDVTWKLPQRQGTYWLTARTTGIRGRPVLSQRFVRAVTPPKIPDRMRRKRFIVLGPDHAAQAWFRSNAMQTAHDLDDLNPAKDMIVIWNADRLTALQKTRARDIRTFIDAGGKVAVLATRHWDFTDLCNVKPGDVRGSRAFLYDAASDHPMLEGIRPDWLIRWNARPGTVAVANLEDPPLENAHKILWVRDPQTCVAAEIPVPGSTKTILFSQLDLQGRLNPSDNFYDPVAERILINILAAE
ncbi:MAG: hypothetical protein JW720_07685 [Sedimentisphaerales bacterium]|nr:hypothetical protein [Sedimentisphaerales bacterium]